MGILLILVAAAAIGVALGLTALGGFLLVPVLAALAPMPLPDAIAISLFTSIPTALYMLTQFRRQGVPVGDGAAAFIAASAAGGLIGASLVPLLAPGRLASLLGLVVLTSSALALADVGNRIARRRSAGESSRSPASSTPASSGPAAPGPGVAARTVVAACSALVATMTGAGGPVISIPLLLAIGVDVRRAIVASLWMMLAGTTTATAINLAHGNLHIALAVTCSAVILAGNFVGVRLGRGLDTTTYRRIVAITGVVLGAWLLVRALTAA